MTADDFRLIPLAPAASEGDAGVDAVVRELARRWRATAVARDAAGGHAAEERQAIRDSGLLALTVPLELGGCGQPPSVLLRCVRQLAAADSALAHVFAFHHLQLASLRLYGTLAQQRHHLGEVVTSRHFWGNALNSLDRRLLALPADRRDGGWWLQGHKGYASGSLGADRLVVSAWHEGSASLLVAVVPGQAPGVHVQGDWDAFGQRQTDSGSVRFEGVYVPAAHVLLAPGQVQTPRQTLRSLLSQLVLVHLYLGLTDAALDEAWQAAGSARAWPLSGLDRAVDDPLLQRRAGELDVQREAASALAERARSLYDTAEEQGEALRPTDRAEVAVAVARAKVLAHRAALDASSQLFEFTGTSGTARSRGLDRFWRNARVHTLHDPLDQKLRDLGRHALTGQGPEPSPYS